MKRSNCRHGFSAFISMLLAAQNFATLPRITTRPSSSLIGEYMMAVFWNLVLVLPCSRANEKHYNSAILQCHG